MQAQLRQILDNKKQKDQKDQLLLLKSWGQQQGVGSKSRVLQMPPALNTTKGVDQLSKPRLWCGPWTDPYSHCMLRNQFAPPCPSIPGNLLLVLLPPVAAGVP